MTTFRSDDAILPDEDFARVLLLNERLTRNQRLRKHGLSCNGSQNMREQTYLFMVKKIQPNKIAALVLQRSCFGWLLE